MSIIHFYYAGLHTLTRGVTLNLRRKLSKTGLPPSLGNNFKSGHGEPALAGINSTRPGYSWSIYGMFILPVLVILVPFFYHAYELGNLLGEAKEEYEAAEWQVGCTNIIDRHFV